jgi:hypothetical protein
VTVTRQTSADRLCASLSICERSALSLHRLAAPSQHAVFTPKRLTVETDEGAVLGEWLNPRASFAGHSRETPSDDLHQVYLSSYAMWTYLTVPFNRRWHGFELTEIEPWLEDQETWRRLVVTLPAQAA